MKATITLALIAILGIVACKQRESKSNGSGNYRAITVKQHNIIPVYLNARAGNTYKPGDTLQAFRRLQVGDLKESIGFVVSDTHKRRDTTITAKGDGSELQYVTVILQ